MGLRQIGLPCLLALSTFGHGQEPAPFGRTYKVGEKVVYTVTQSVNFGGAHSFSVDISLSASKLLEKNGAEMVVHMSNMRSSNSTDTMPALPKDFPLKLTAHNMPDQFSPTMGGVDFEVLLLQLAAYTPDKVVNSGEDFPVTWKNGLMAFAGTGKVLEISAEKKTRRVQIKVNTTMNGQAVGEFTFTSTYGLANSSLIQSTGQFSLGPQDFTFVRKGSAG